jgi:exoribonuclease R
VPARPIRVLPATAVRDGVRAIRREAGVPDGFDPHVQAEAARSAHVAHSAGRVDLPFATIDPPGSRDLDQAMHIERRGDGHRVR